MSHTIRKTPRQTKKTQYQQPHPITWQVNNHTIHHKTNTFNKCNTTTLPLRYSDVAQSNNACHALHRSQCSHAQKHTHTQTASTFTRKRNHNPSPSKFIQLPYKNPTNHMVQPPTLMHTTGVHSVHKTVTLPNKQSAQKTKEDSVNSRLFHPWTVDCLDPSVDWSTLGQSTDSVPKRSSSLVDQDSRLMTISVDCLMLSRPKSSKQSAEKKSTQIRS